MPFGGRGNVGSVLGPGKKSVMFECFFHSGIVTRPYYEPFWRFWWLGVILVENEREFNSIDLPNRQNFAVISGGK